MPELSAFSFDFGISLSDVERIPQHFLAVGKNAKFILAGRLKGHSHKVGDRHIGTIVGKAELSVACLGQQLSVGREKFDPLGVLSGLS